MALRNPVAAYNAASNVEAHVVKGLLVDAGIEAFVSEDLSTGGLWMLGTLPEIHKPQVWIDQADGELARRVLREYESQKVRRKRDAAQDTGQPLEVVCEECGHKASFPAAQRGTIQECPRCRAYVDVGEFEDGGSWLEVDEPEVD